ncbi:hypothetical protein AWC29_29470 [Mycobacterium triplex]|uniref:Uncharacterized protein n=1 Tax=Mycobacterium triplex TaxID=47839 RepID=A0ABX3VWR3_9MYCO|nr:hypothetical protein AWC29_29470 [Mycobacterium triplex]
MIGRPSTSRRPRLGVRTDAEHRLPTTAMPPPRIPRPTALVVSPHQLQGTDTWAEEPDRELQVDIRMLDLDHFDKKSVLVVDMHCRCEHRTVVDDHVSNGIEDATARVGGQTRQQQFG